MFKYIGIFLLSLMLVGCATKANFDVRTQKVAYKILYKFVHATNINWYDLYKNEKYIIQAFEIGLRKQFKKLIE